MSLTIEDYLIGDRHTALASRGGQDTMIRARPNSITR